MEYHPSEPLAKALRIWLTGISDKDFCEFAFLYPEAAENFTWELFALTCAVYRVWEVLHNKTMKR